MPILILIAAVLVALVEVVPVAHGSLRAPDRGRSRRAVRRGRAPRGTSPSPLKSWRLCRSRCAPTCGAAYRTATQPSTSVRLKQTGQMRLKPGQPWRPFQATQYYTPEPLGFVWRVGMAMLPGVRVVGRDTYARQHGHMLIKLYSALPVVDKSGPKIAVGAFVRLIADCFGLVPDGAGGQPAPPMGGGGRSHGSRRRHGWGHAGGRHLPLRRSGRSRPGLLAGPLPRRDRRPADTLVCLILGGYREFAGVRIPAEAEVVWELEAGPFPWWQGTITALEYNVPEAY